MHGIPPRGKKTLTCSYNIYKPKGWRSLPWAYITVIITRIKARALGAFSEMNQSEHIPLRKLLLVLPNSCYEYGQALELK